ncbi:MAG TPA: class I SAM-dependent methyltransferase [Acidimicrobiales bacterium]|nr:class I SAM-dependent methyltransferase [Acidimicrobiales bacterium]
MLAKAELPTDYQEWNERWGAPQGRNVPLQWLPWLRLSRLSSRVSTMERKLRGPFAWQANSPVRRWEYPWVAAQLPTGGRLLEIGGAMSGLQFALATDKGGEVHNVDPFYDYGNGPGEYAMPPEGRHEQLNATYGTNVVLHHSVLEEANVDGPFDAVLCVSVIEHMPIEAVKSTLKRADELLKSGGRLVLTLDLFLDVTPFCSAESNRWGTNVAPAMIAEFTGYRLVEGDRRELLGFPEFSPDYVMSNLWDYLSYRSNLAQCFVLEKP